MHVLCVTLLALVGLWLVAGCSSNLRVADYPGDDTTTGPIRVKRYEQIPVDAIDKLRAAVDLANQVLRSPAFTDAAQRVHHWDHRADHDALPRHAGRDIAAHLQQPRNVVIRGWDPARHWYVRYRVEAFANHNHIHVNMKRLQLLSEVDWAHILAHEFCHVAGYAHCGNRSRGNENSVPYRVGELVLTLATDRQSQPPDTIAVAAD